MCLNHLKVKTDVRTVHISALFDRNVPNTTIGYGAATMLGLKGGRASHQVTTADGKKETSNAWSNVLLLHVGEHTRQVKANGEHGPHQDWRKERRGLR